MDTALANTSCVDTCTDRRSLLRASGALATTLGLLLSASAGGMLSGCAPQAAVLPHGEAVLTALADIMLPATQTPSAGTPDNIAFILRALHGGLLGISGDTLDRLITLLDKKGPTSFLDLPSQSRLARLEQLDAHAFSLPRPQEHPWFTIKALILMAYYTSEAGMTAELRYDIVPGDFVPDQAVDASWRASSNDWSAVSIKKPLHA